MIVQFELLILKMKRPDQHLIDFIEKQVLTVIDMDKKIMVLNIIFLLLLEKYSICPRNGSTISIINDYKETWGGLNVRRDAVNWRNFLSTKNYATLSLK